jgi:DNA-binding response OmpR family regulator
MARVLVVDDDSQIRKLICRVLTERGHAVMAASDGTKGIRYFSVMEPDLLILDLAMPGTDGFKVLRAIKRQAVESGAKIIVLSGQTSEPHRLRAYELGAHHFISKPFVIEDVIDGVDQVLNLPEAQLAARKDADPFKGDLLTRLENLFSS